MTTIQLPEIAPGLPGSDPATTVGARVMIGAVDNVYCRMMYFARAGDREQGHTHNYDHFTLLAAGRLRVTVGGVSTDYVAPYMIYIAREFEHELLALEDHTAAYCIHALRDPEGVVLDPTMIPLGVRSAQRVRSQIPGWRAEDV